MRRFHVAMAGFLIAVAPAAAQADDNPLRVAMGMLPAFSLGTGDGAITQYLNVQAVMAQGNGTFSPENWPALGTLQDVAPVGALLAAGPEVWAEKSGAGLDQIAFFAGYGTTPFDVAIWGFQDEAAASNTFAGLSDRGFLVTEGVPDFMANGQPMQVNFEAIDPTDPWRGPMGQASAVTRRGAVLLQSFDPGKIESLRGEMLSMIDTPAGQALFATLDAQDGDVLQASFFGPMTGLYDIDPALLISANPETVQKTVEAAAAKANSGVPLYAAGALAALNDPTGPTGVLVLAYGDCTTAEDAAAKAAALWQDLDGAPEGLIVRESTVDAGGSGCAAVITARASDANAPYLHAAGGIIRRDFTPIRIGTE